MGDNGGLHALEGFSYQEIVSLELILDHFDQNEVGATARPEGEDDLDLRWVNGGEHLRYVQIKKPSTDDAGTPTTKTWRLPGVVTDLLVATWRRRAPQSAQWWVLGDDVDADVWNLLAERETHDTWEEAVYRLTRALLPEETGIRLTGWPTWSIARAADDLGELLRGKNLPVDQYLAVETVVRRELPDLLSRTTLRPSYGSFDDVQDRITRRLCVRTGLGLTVVRDTLRRNLRCFIVDVARARGRSISAVDFELELKTIWPRMVPVVEPPPLQEDHVYRKNLVRDLVREDARVVSLVGPSGAGKTALTVELIEEARERDRVAFYAEVRRTTSIRDVLAGLAYRLYRMGEKGPFSSVANLDSGDAQAIAEATRALDTLPRRVTLVCDLADGTVDVTGLRDVALLARALQPGGSLQLLVAGQIDALVDLSGVERETLGVRSRTLPGLSFEEFMELARRTREQDEHALWRVYSRVTARRESGLLPTLARALVTDTSDADRLSRLPPEDLLAEAHRRRLEEVEAPYRETACKLACLLVPFTPEFASETFFDDPTDATIRRLASVGLLQPLSDGRCEFHETVRRGVLAQFPSSTRREANRHLCERFRVSDPTLAAFYAFEGGDIESAKTLARDAFLDPATPHRVLAIVVEQRWVTSGEVLDLVLSVAERAPWAWFEALRRFGDQSVVPPLVELWRRYATPGSNGDQSAALHLASAVLGLDNSKVVDLAVISLQSTPRPRERAVELLAWLVIAARRRAATPHPALDRLFEQRPAAERSRLLKLLAVRPTPDRVHRIVREVLQSPVPDIEITLELETDTTIHAFLDALPDHEASKVIALRDWGFGRLAGFVWRQRAVLLPACQALLEVTDTAPRQAERALRVLGFLGDQNAVGLSVRWVSTPGPQKPLALLFPALLGRVDHLPRLRAMVNDANADVGDRWAAVYVCCLLGDDLLSHYQSFVEKEPESESKWRFLATASFSSAPSPALLRLVVEDLQNTEEARPLATTSIVAAERLADRSDANRIAATVAPLLEHSSAQVRFSVAMLFLRLRDAERRPDLLRLATSDPSAEIRRTATLAAMASGPTTVDEMRAAILQSEQPHLLSVLIGRLRARDASPELCEVAAAPTRSWQERRLALLALGRLGDSADVERIAESVLSERSGLSRLDDAHATVQSTFAELFGRHLPQVAPLLRLDRASFASELGRLYDPSAFLVVKSSPATAESCAQQVWDMTRNATGSLDPQLVAAVFDVLNLPCVQAAALRALRRSHCSAQLENVARNSDNAFLVVRALCELTRLGEARSSNLLEAIASGPLARDHTVQMLAANLLQKTRAARPSSSVVEEREVTRLSLADALKFLDEEPAGEQPLVLDLAEEEVATLAEQLHPRNDSSVEILAPVGSTIVWAPEGAMVTGARTKTVSAPNRRSVRARLRAALIVANRWNVPTSWPDKRLNLNQLFEAAIAAGDSDRTFELAEANEDALARSLGRGSPLHVLRPHLDERFLPLLTRLAHVGTAEQLIPVAHAVATYDSAAADHLVSLILARAVQEIGTPEALPIRADNPSIRAVLAILKSPRISAIDGVGSDLARVITCVRGAHPVEAEVVRALRNFPSTWFLAETTLFHAPDFVPWNLDLIDIADDVADDLFKETHGPARTTTE